MSFLTSTFRFVWPLAKQKRILLSRTKDSLSFKERISLWWKLKQKDCTIHEKKLDFSFKKFTIVTIGGDSVLQKKMWMAQRDTIIDSFKEHAFEVIPHYIAPQIVGLDCVKQTASLLLATKEPLHILLLGDPGTGKTEILRSVKDLSPIATLGLGSGTTGTGLAVTIQGKNVKRGLLPLAHNGVCCIDELNLMQKRDAASLYNAMEKGFISYDKGGHHIQFDAYVKVIATANPKGDVFESSTLAGLKKEIPFDSALLTRFHLVHVIRKPNVERFSKISEKILSGSSVKVPTEIVEFVKDYVCLAQDIKPTIPAEFKKEINAFLTWLKKQEKQFLVEISPRSVVGFSRMLKASAALHLRDKVNKSDLKKVKQLFLESLEY